MGIRESLTLTWQDLDQSPLSLFTYCEEAMATKPSTNLSTARLWNANTQATYHRMMEKMQALYFDSLGLPFRDLEFEHFSAAVDAYVQQSKAKSKSGEVSDATKDKLCSILKSLSSFVHEKLPAYSDPCWGSIWNYHKTALPKRSAGKKEELRQLREQEIAEIVKLPRSLQIREEIKFAKVLRKGLNGPDGVFIGGLLMLYLGLRPSECCGLTYRAIQPLTKDGNVKALYIYRALDTSNKSKNQLKTKNAYRVLPIPAELDSLLQERMQYIQKSHPNGCLEDFPIVNSPEDCTKFCTRKHFGDTIRNLLRSIRTNEESLVYASHLLEANKSVKEESPTAYLLRRHYATILSSVCLMTEEELQYLMGHDIRNADIRHFDLLDTDWLLHMYDKLNRRHIFTETQSDLASSKDSFPENISEASFRFIDTDFRGSNPEFIIDIWNTCPADALTLSVKAESRTEKGAVLYEADYRPIAENLPPMIRFDSAYHRALEKSANKSAGRTKNKAQP